MIQADVDSHERPAMWEVGRRHPGVLFQMLGLYPGSVAADWREELDQVFSLSGERDCVAIGEIGLDYHEGLEFVQQQKEVLKGLASGDVNILIGTHRLLGKDVKFKDLF